VGYDLLLGIQQVPADEPLGSVPPLLAPALSRTPQSFRNSTPNRSNVALMAVKPCSCMVRLPFAVSARCIADCETPDSSDRWRADQLSSARAARIWAGVRLVLLTIALSGNVRAQEKRIAVDFYAVCTTQY
jgi:hypothetical protein